MLIVIDSSVFFKSDQARNPAKNQLFKGCFGMALSGMN